MIPGRVIFDCDKCGGEVWMPALYWPRTGSVDEIRCSACEHPQMIVRLFDRHDPGGPPMFAKLADGAVKYDPQDGPWQAPA